MHMHTARTSYEKNPTRFLGGFFVFIDEMLRLFLDIFRAHILVSKFT